MMTTLREAAQQALEACADAVSGWQSLAPLVVRRAAEESLDALKAALAEPPTNQCGETCERAKLCATCARELTEPMQEPVAWMPIETAPKGRILLVYYLNKLGNGRTMRARYYLPETLDSDTTESGWADEGWYEESEAYEYLMPLDGEPTHWMHLPAAPKGGDKP